MPPPPSACDPLLPRRSMPTPFAPQLDLSLPAYPQFSDPRPPRPADTPPTAHDSLAGLKRKRAPSDTPEYRRDEPAPAKRRILSVVGSTVGGVLRGAWEIVRPRIWGLVPAAAAAGAAAAPAEEVGEKQDAGEKPDAEKKLDGGEKEGDGSAGWDAKSVSLTPEPGEARWLVVQPAAAERQHPPTRRRGATVPGGRPGRLVAGRRAGLRKSALAGAARSPNRRRNSVGAGKRSAEDDEMEEYMRRVDRQMKDLIRQGKEALGAKVEVEYDDEDMF